MIKLLFMNRCYIFIILDLKLSGSDGLIFIVNVVVVYICW
jgi:hypothetical protein